MNKLLLVAVAGLLAACGGDAGKKVQTYQSLIDAAKSDASKLSSQMANGVELRFKPSEFSGNLSVDKYVLMRHKSAEEAQDNEMLAMTFSSNDKTKLQGSEEVKAKCTRNTANSEVGIAIILKDCQLI